MDLTFAVLSIIVNLLTCPLVTLWNSLVIIAVKKKRRLQTKYNVLLACLAGTDLIVGIAAQPVFVTQEIIRIFSGSSSTYCKLKELTKTASICLFLASLLHLAFIAVERLVAMKYSLRYKSIVTKFRLAVAVSCCWVFITAYCLTWMVLKEMPFPSVLLVIPCFLIIIFSHVSVYLVCRRHIIRIKAEQVSREAASKFLEERKAWKTTSIIIGGLVVCYLPGFLSAVMYAIFPDPSSLPNRVTASSQPMRFSSFMMNSFVNPIIYCWRSKVMRQAMLQLLRNRDD